MNNPFLFEISAWPWLERLSRTAGRRITLADVPAEEWDRIAQDGFEIVFLMGVWRRSAIGREIARTDPGLRGEYDRVLPGWSDTDVPGSPYCIQAYEPDERMGGWPGLDAVRRELHARGVKLMVDFVPNHTGFDHEWIASHPERYVLGTEDDYLAAPADFRPVESGGRTMYVACGRDPYFAPWTDVAQLNYFNPDTRAAMRGVLAEIAAHADGVRCDMAMLVLNEVFERTWRRILRDAWPWPSDEFWPGATRAVPSMVYMAEVYWGLEGTVLHQGFTFAYDKRLLDSLHAHGPETAGRVRDLLWSDQPPRHQLARFLENHDEPRAAAMLHGRERAAATLLATTPGLRFFFDGQMEGAKIKPPVQLGRWPDEPPDERLRDLYAQVLAAGRDPVFHTGDWRMCQVAWAGDHSFNDIVAYLWRSGDRLAVITVNLGSGSSQGHVAIADALLPGGVFDFEDRLTGASYRWTREALQTTGLYVRLDAGDAHLFNVRTAE